MKTMVRFLILFFFFSAGVIAADIFDDIGNALRSGDVEKLGKYFNANVDLTILNQEEVYSKAQAEMMIKQFFAKNTPKSFAIINQGVSKDGARYAIGTLTTAQGLNYR